VSSTVSVVLFPPGFAAFQNCFWAEYLFIGHNLNRQSGRENSKHTQKQIMKKFTGYSFIKFVHRALTSVKK